MILQRQSAFRNVICGIPQGSMLGLDEQTEKLEADLKSLSKIDDSVGVKQSGEFLSDDHDAPTSKKGHKKIVPAVQTFLDAGTRIEAVSVSKITMSSFLFQAKVLLL